MFICTKKRITGNGRIWTPSLPNHDSFNPTHRNSRLRDKEFTQKRDTCVKVNNLCEMNCCRWGIRLVAYPHFITGENKIMSKTKVPFATTYLGLKLPEELEIRFNLYFKLLSWWYVRLALWFRMSLVTNCWCQRETMCRQITYRYSSPH